MLPSSHEVYRPCATEYWRKDKGSIPAKPLSWAKGATAEALDASAASAPGIPDARSGSSHQASPNICLPLPPAPHHITSGMPASSLKRSGCKLALVEIRQDNVIAYILRYMVRYVLLISDLLKIFLLLSTITAIHVLQEVGFKFHPKTCSRFLWQGMRSDRTEKTSAGIPTMWVLDRSPPSDTHRGVKERREQGDHRTPRDTQHRRMPEGSRTMENNS